jgi:tRNA(Ile)-lysidine synthase
MLEDSESIGPAELDRLFARCFADRPHDRFALAVSGGSDSTALMVLMAEWIASTGRRLETCTVLTVDHRLRPESASEAEAVARQAAALGLRHATLVWDGDKPRTGLQAAARAARYGLMAAYARAHGIGAILTAHTQDDQAETLLMRLARSSGLDGLSAMARIGPLPNGESVDGDRLGIARPLLEVSKARLQATLRQRGIGWIEDPSNASPAFERVRLRSVRAALDSIGLTPAILALSARRLQQARVALDRWVADALDPAAGIVEVHPCGFISFDRCRLAALPEEIVVRLLARGMAVAGGVGEPVPLAGLEAIVREVVDGQASGAWTLARAMATASPGRLLVEREPGRKSLPVLSLAPGGVALWDGRFRVTVDARWVDAVEVRALGVEGLRDLRTRIEVPADIPVGSLRAVPSFSRGDRLLAVPPLGFWADGDARTQLAATFVGLARGQTPCHKDPDESTANAQGADP